MSNERMTDTSLADAIKRACQYYKQAGRVASTSQMLATQHESTADKIIASALRARPQAVAVPDERIGGMSDFDDMYVLGWNDCRRTMLAASQSATGGAT